MDIWVLERGVCTWPGGLDRVGPGDEAVVGRGHECGRDAGVCEAIALITF